MSDWAPHQNLQKELDAAQARLALEGPTPDRLFSCAALQHALGRLDEAKAGYLEALKRDTAHRGALTQLGALLRETNYLRAASTVYQRLIALEPSDSAPRVGLGHVLWERDDHEGARLQYEAALALDPEDAAAHQGMAAVLNELRQTGAALEHARKGFKGQACMRLPYRGDQAPVRILVLAAAAGGNIPVFRAIDDREFSTTLLFTEFFDPHDALPAHSLVWNAIGDADTCGPALELAESLLHKTRAPVLNPPDRVALTGRSDNARRLSGIEDLVVPRIADFTRQELERPDAAGLFDRAGFGFPVLLRAQGFHAGKHFAKLDTVEALAPTLKAMPGEGFSVIQFMDARGHDGLIRKYRVMMIGQGLYPLHAATSGQWKVHYFSADMRGQAANQSADKFFLEDMAGALGPKAMAALEKVRTALGLDYAGMDFSLNSRGQVLFYEANATMVISPPDADAQWDYRRAPVRRAVDAVNALLRARAGR